jgi:hypothetical protein
MSDIEHTASSGFARESASARGQAKVHDEYRVYVLTKDDRVSLPPIIIDAFNETAAVEEASHLLDETAIEVWDQDRLIARPEPKGSSR